MAGSDKNNAESKGETKIHEDKNNSDKGNKESHGPEDSAKWII